MGDNCMSEHLVGYVFANEGERKQAGDWYRRHKHEIPNMEDGSRINGDPIIYLGIPEDWQLRALMPDRFEREDDIEATERDKKNTLTNQLRRKAVIEADLTPMQAWVLQLRSMGLRQEEIAKILKTKQQSVDRAEKVAAYKITLNVNTTAA